MRGILILPVNMRIKVEVEEEAEVVEEEVVEEDDLKTVTTKRIVIDLEEKEEIKFSYFFSARWQIY